jgi:radical SAM superfamily enzyme
VNKQITIEKIRRAFALARENDIRTIASVVLGMPGDTGKVLKEPLNSLKNSTRPMQFSVWPHHILEPDFIRKQCRITYQG